ncbi:hypothetical protein [Lutibaculum baratangense]|nr:hypothetical protein [Lutibaculum baratangense]
MTTLATLPEDLKLLFDRLDVTANTPALRDALEHWREARGQNVFPAAGDLDLPHARGAYDRLFVLFLSEGGQGEWELVSGGAEARALLMPSGSWPRLDKFRNEGLALRLRRLLELVREKGEPVVASFSLDDAVEHQSYELLVAPLSTTGEMVDGALCGIGTG